MMYVLGVLFMVAGVGLSIALHEIGHLVPAKKFGVKCSQYMVGFGPTLWSRRRGETEYGIKAIPLGGYVRMIGMFPPKPGTDGTLVPASSTGRWTAMIDDARNQSMEEVGPDDRDRVFYKLSTPKKIVVMLGGPVMNLLIATVILGGLLTLHGQAVQVGAQVASVAECVRPVTATAADQPACTAADQRTPAAAAGLKPGDRILSIGGTPVNGVGDVSAAIRPHAGTPLTMVVDRAGQKVDLSLTPIRSQLPKLDADGQVVTSAAGTPESVEAGYVGMSSAPVVEVQRQPLTAVPGVVGDAVAQTAGIILHIPQKMVGVWNAAFSSQERDVNGPISVVGVGRVAGEVADGQIAGVQSPGDILVMLLSLLASLNIALFVFNLIPLMPLDGGHVAGALWEGLKRTLARVTGRPDPGYVDVAKGLPIAYAMSIALIGMSALLIYADLVKPVRF